DVVLERHIILRHRGANSVVVRKTDDVRLEFECAASFQLNHRAARAGLPTPRAFGGIAREEHRVVADHGGAGGIYAHHQAVAIGVHDDVVLEDQERGADIDRRIRAIQKETVADRHRGIVTADLDQRRDRRSVEIERAVLVAVPGGAVEYEAIENQAVAVLFRIENLSRGPALRFFLRVERETRGICPGIASFELRVVSAEKSEVADGEQPLPRAQLSKIVAARDMNGVAALGLLQGLERIPKRLLAAAVAARGAGTHEPVAALGTRWNGWGK